MADLNSWIMEPQLRNANCYLCGRYRRMIEGGAVCQDCADAGFPLEGSGAMKCDNCKQDNLFPFDERIKMRVCSNCGKTKPRDGSTPEDGGAPFVPTSKASMEILFAGKAWRPFGTPNENMTGYIGVLLGLAEQWGVEPPPGMVELYDLGVAELREPTPLATKNKPQPRPSPPRRYAGGN